MTKTGRRTPRNRKIRLGKVRKGASCEVRGVDAEGPLWVDPGGFIVVTRTAGIDCEETFAGAPGDSGVAPIPVVPVGAVES